MIRVIDKNGNIKSKIINVTSGLTSAAFSALSARVASNSAQMTSADDAISNAVSVVSAAQAATSADLTSVKNQMSALSQAVSVLSQSVSVLSVRVGGNSAQMTSADNALYQAVSVISQQVSVLSARVTSNSVQMTSADDAISNAVSVVGAAQAVTSAAVTSVNQAISVISQQVSVLSARVASNSADFTSFKQSIDNFGDVSVPSPADGQVIAWSSAAAQWVASTVAGTASVTSTEYLSLVNRVSANSAQMTSADDAISNAVSIVSAAQAATSAAVTSVNQVISVISQQVSVISQQLSVLSTRVAGNSVQMTSADNAISNAVSIVSAAQAVTSAAVTSVNQVVSVLSQQVSVLSARVASNSADFTSFKASINNFGDVSTSSPTSAQVLRYVSATGQWINQTITGGSGSVTSANFVSLRSAVQANSAQMTSADNAISNAVSIVSAAQAVTSAAVTSVNQVVSVLSQQISVLSQQVSVISQQVSVLSVRVADNSAQMTSADNAISNAVSIVSAAQAATSAEVTSVRNRLSAVSADLTSFKASLNNFGDVSTGGATSGQALIYRSASAEWVASAIAGTASVTSAEYLSLVNRVSTNSAQMTSADNAISNAVSIVSAAQAVTSAAVTSINQVISVISQQVSVLSQQVSALSQANSAAHVSIMSAISVNSAQMTSADNAISNAVSIVSAAQAVTSAAVTSVNNRISGVSADLTSFKASINNFTDVSIASPTDQQVLVWNSAAAQWVNSTAVGGTASVTSAEYASTVSIVSTLQWPAVESNASAVYSVVEADRGKVKYFTTTTSIEVVLPNGITSGFQAVVYRASGAGVIRFSAATAYEAAGSALNDAKTAATIINRGSDNWLVLGAFLPSELGDLSNRVSVLSQAVSVLSQSVSVLSQAVSALSVTVVQNAPTTKIVADSQGISATTLTDISGLSATFSTGGIYKLNFHVVYSVSAAGNIRFGFSSPGAVRAHGNMLGDVSIDAAYPFTSSRTAGAWFNFRSAGATVVMSTASAVAAGVVHGMIGNGLFVSATAGSFKLMAAVSATGAPMTILPGSYIQSFKIG
jgi:predicted  nucleic acid-binding Zn-ribbon protein